MKTRLGHYEIVAELGRGGMGVVYKGYESSLARYVAIKELSPSLAHEEVVVERFLREARSMALLNDPHIIQIYSIGQENEQPFFVMEFVEGTSLSDLIKREGHLHPSDALKIVHQTAQGLAAAHHRGVIHRDVKPANMILSLRGQVKIADFGIALANHDMDAKLTSQGEFVGTPGYLSPEVVLGKQVDQRTDIYALGVVLFEMLTGRTPFSDASVYKLMLDVVQTEVPDVREVNAEIDPGVAAILAKMLLKDPAKRYQSMVDLIADLEKHPLVARGGPLQIKATAGAALGDSVSTRVGLAMPMTPGARPLGTKTPAKLSSIPVASPSTPISNSKLSTPVAHTTDPGATLLAVERLDVPNAEAILAPKKNVPYRIIFYGILFLLLAIAAWWLMQRPTGDISNLSVISSQLQQWLIPAQLFVTDIYVSAKAQGILLINPLLDKLGLRIPAGLIFDIIMVLLGLSIIRSLFSRLFKRREKNHGDGSRNS